VPVAASALEWVGYVAFGSSALTAVGALAGRNWSMTVQALIVAGIVGSLLWLTWWAALIFVAAAIVHITLIALEIIG
jgi:hypothetical protein